jgi:hypothetical protein
MKKLVPLLIVAAFIGGVWLFVKSQRSSTTEVASTTTTVQEGSESNTSGSNSGFTDSGNKSVTSDTTNVEETPQFTELKTATEAFSSADEALAAVQKGAKDYDDSVLEQFTQPGSDCTWCPAFYTSVRDLVNNPNTSKEEKSYYAELLAISGRVENVQSLADAIKNAKSKDEADVYAQALELSVGKDDVAAYLGEQMSSTNESLREASVAAVTNQGSRLAAELLVKNVADRGDPDGYYSVGIGLGEFIPEEEAIPVIQEMVQKHDQYSHLGVKSLINSGIDGLRIVFDEIESMKDTNTAQQMLKDAIDHVNYEDNIDELTNAVIKRNKSPVAVEFAKKIQEEFSQQDTEEAGDNQSSAAE